MTRAGPAEPIPTITVGTCSGTTAVAVTARLQAAGCLAAEEEAHELLAPAPDAAVLDEWLSRREAGEPLAWITGRTEFCGRRILVDPGVYVPRPHTEELVRRAATVVGSGRAADLCTGSGAVAAALAMAAPSAQVVAVDLDAVAAACARRNGVAVIRGDLGTSLASRSFDVVTAVAPYVPTGDLPFLPRDVLAYEPRDALEGGEDGLEVVRRILSCAARILRPGGWVLLEVGGHQDELLAASLAWHRFTDLTTWQDEDGDLRGVMARLDEGGR